MGSGAEHYFAAMKKLLFLGVCLVALASQPVLAQAESTEVIVVRIQESSVRTHLTIERAGQEPQEKEFDRDSRIGRKWPRASKGYYEALAPFYQQGYQTQAVIPGTSFSNGGSTYSTLILTKPSK